ncbi:unnamed protein product [Blepharisma stoltei]|uniref:Uncharacterized protein n=1 Tax=Blepharisma stoltei TaxID=1481888 RepID=A0AAU9INS2_9CILI|nr:unnamed protein product [Blepharisma stoltei]
MGCLHSNSNEITTLEEELLSLRQKKAAYNEILFKSPTKTIQDLPQDVYNSAIEEQLWASKSFKQLMNLIGTSDPNFSEVQNKLNLIINSDEKSADYIWIRLFESNWQTNLCNSLTEIATFVKEIDNKKAQHIKSKAQSVEYLIKEKYSMLTPMLNEIKNREMKYSSARGGTILQMIERVYNRGELEKELEILQTKLEGQQYLQLRQEKDEDVEKLKEKISAIKNEMSEIERAWELVKTNFEADPELVKGLETILNEKVDKIQEMKAEIEKLQKVKNGINEVKDQIDTVNANIREQEKNIQKILKKIQELNEEKEKMIKINETLPSIKERIEDIKLENNNKKNQIKILQEKNKNIQQLINEITEKMNSKIMIKEKIIQEIKEKGENEQNEILVHQNTRSHKIKKQLALRLKEALYRIPDRLLQRWKLVVFHKEKPEICIAETTTLQDTESMYNETTNMTHDQSYIGDISMINHEENLLGNEDINLAKAEIAMISIPVPKKQPKK